MPAGTLYVVATPIGNLEDITFRAISTLKKADLIACEDTRQTKKLLNRYKISKPLISYHQHSKLQKIDFIIAELKSGKNMVLVSDAGTPGISDPGGVLVQRAWEEGIKIIPIPGACAAAAALSACGFAADQFLFLGFLPKKKGRQTLLTELKDEKRTIVLYESPHRLMKTLEDLGQYLGERTICVARELTKIFEEIKRGQIPEIFDFFKNHPEKIKGEFVICIGNATKKNKDQN